MEIPNKILEGIEDDEEAYGKEYNSKLYK